MADVDFASMTAKEKASYMVNVYTNAELAIIDGGQSYSISGKTLTRADLSNVIKQRKYWENQLAIINGKTARKVKQVHVRH